MIRRFNYTGRIEVPHRLVTITLIERPTRRFEADWNLAELGLPGEAAVYIEAYSSGSPAVMRFDYGVVGAKVAPPSTELSEVDGERPWFDLKVVASSGDVGRLLAVASQMRPGNDQVGTHPLLPVNPTNLDRQVWRLNITHEQGDGRPWLEVNNRIEGIMRLAKDDRVFFALVYPEVVRRILFEIVVTQGYTDLEDSADKWQAQWLRWATERHPAQAPPPLTIDDEVAEALEWIDAVVASFCRRHDVVSLFTGVEVVGS